MHYIYPYPHVADFIQLMAEGKILPYFDIPFQNASPRVSKNMRRPEPMAKRRWIASVRGARPDRISPSAQPLVGFPGETEEDFEMLLDWLDEAKIDRDGCFKYEPVKGARSNDLGFEKVQDGAKEAHWHRFMQFPLRAGVAKLIHGSGGIVW